MTVPSKGSSRVADVPPDVLAQLHAGTLATATLAEGLAIDFAKLMTAAAPDLPAESLEIVVASADRGVTRRMETCGQVLLDHLGLDGLPRLIAHPSDTVRGWAAFAVGLAPKLKLQDRLALVRPLADDPHFGVREWAWLPLRVHVAKHVAHAIAALTPWTAEASANLRRFAVESTRPRGVWSVHIAQLKTNPAPGLPLLEPLKADPSAYVQDAVGNWLNDAAKTHAGWVNEVCGRWRAESPCPATERICKRATRGGR